MLLPCTGCAPSQGVRLCPGNCRYDSGSPSAGHEAAVYAYDDIITGYKLSIACDALGDEFQVLDEVSRRVDTPGTMLSPQVIRVEKEVAGPYGLLDREEEVIVSGDSLRRLALPNLPL